MGKRIRYTEQDIQNKIPEYSFWTVVGIDNSAKGRAFLLCKCGVKKSVTYSSAINGSSISCGCHKSELIRSTRTTIEEINNRRPKNSRLTAISYDEEYNIKKAPKEKAKIICKCECGSHISTYSYDVRSGKSLSCGCYNLESISKRFKKFEGNERGIYGSYKNMIKRCYDPTHKSFKYYGGRGVSVCEEWLKDYNLFLQWSKANGWIKGLHIDKDILGNGLLYSPTTCKWVTCKENNQAQKRKSE